MSGTATGYIRTNSNPGECDEAYEKVRKLIEGSRVTFPESEVTGWETGETAPTDTSKLWLEVDACGARWKYYSETCEEWCLVRGIPGERITRHRINETVAEDLAQYYGCGWVVADGTTSNFDSLDLRGTQVGEPGEFDLLLAEPTFCVEEIVAWIGAGSTTYTALATSAATIPLLVVALNAKFTLDTIPITADVGPTGGLTLTPDSETDYIISVEDCAGEFLLEN